MDKFKAIVSVRDPQGVITDAMEFNVHAKRAIGRLVEATGTYDDLISFLTETFGMSGGEADELIREV